MIVFVCAGDLNALKNTAIVVKEGVNYRLKIEFKVSDRCSHRGVAILRMERDNAHYSMEKLVCTD